MAWAPGKRGWGGRRSPEGLPRKADTGVLASVSEDRGALGSLQWGLVWALNSSLQRGSLEADLSGAVLKTKPCVSGADLGFSTLASRHPWVLTS